MRTDDHGKQFKCIRWDLDLKEENKKGMRSFYVMQTASNGISLYFYNELTGRYIYSDYQRIKN